MLIAIRKGKSRNNAASRKYVPNPGHPKTLSTMTLPNPISTVSLSILQLSLLSLPEYLTSDESVDILIKELVKISEVMSNKIGIN